MKEKFKKWWFMSPEEEIAGDDTVNTRVLPEQRRSTIVQWIFAVAFSYTITAFIVGSDLLASSSSTAYWRNMLIGYGTLGILAFLVAWPAYKTGCNPTIFFRYVFGNKGYIIPSVITIVLLVGHSGFQASTFGEVLFPLGTTQFKLLTLLCGLLVIISTVKGIKGLETASNIAIGFLIFSIVTVFYYSLKEIGGWAAFNTAVDNSVKAKLPDAYLLNVVIGSWTIGASVNGNYTRYSRSFVSMFGFVFITFFFMQIVLALLGSFSILTVDTYIFVAYARKLSNVLGWICSIAFMLALWTTINANIYMSQIPLSAVTKTSIRGGGFIFGALAGIMGAFGFSKYATPILNMSGTILPPFLGPLVVDYYINRDMYFYEPLVIRKKIPNWNKYAMASSILGLVISLIWVPSWMPVSVWSIVLSGGIYVVIFYVMKAMGVKVGLSSIEIDDELRQAKFEPYTPDQLEHKDSKLNKANVAN